ncbi:AB hydrolase superfamily [Fusarium sp. NRRL 52700]|nr:AB hydrolase superfamily [Fusarium sp. NRRL 52700]
MKTGTITTSDGVSLTYNQKGPEHGKQLLFIPGWRQAAVEWKKQVEYFTAAGYRVTTYDMRGHGESAKPNFGYRVSRFAADLNDVLTQLHLKDVTIVGHSMGCSVTWAFWDQYPASHMLVHKIVFADQSADFVIDPTWPKDKAQQMAAIFTPDAVYQTAADMAAQGPALVKSMFTKDLTEADYNWIMEQNKKMSDKNAGTLLIDHAFRDWRDVLPNINVPALVIAGELSIFPYQGVEWVASQIPGAKHYTFSAEEKGSHFMFWQNPEKFNSVVKDFIEV